MKFIVNRTTGKVVSRQPDDWSGDVPGDCFVFHRNTNKPKQFIRDWNETLAKLDQADQIRKDAKILYLSAERQLAKINRERQEAVRKSREAFDRERNILDERERSLSNRERAIDQREQALDQKLRGFEQQMRQRILRIEKRESSCRRKERGFE